MRTKTAAPVVSSFIESVTLSKDEEDLIIQMNGTYYLYKGAGNWYWSMIDAASKGKFYNEHIKNRFEAEKLGRGFPYEYADPRDEEQFDD